MPLCSNCGKENREGSRFCQSCGTPLGDPSSTKTQGSSKKTSQEIAGVGATCGACGAPNAPGMKFCKMCGAPLETASGQPAKVSCPSCGGQTPGGFKFCQHCGTPLQKGAPSGVPPTRSSGGPASSIQSALSPAAMRGDPEAARPTTPPPQPVHPDIIRTVVNPPGAIRSSVPAETAKTVIELDGKVSAAPLKMAPPAVAASAPVPEVAEKVAPPPVVAEKAAVALIPAAPGREPTFPTATPPAGAPAAREPEPRSPSRATLGPGGGRPPVAAEPSGQLLARVVSVNRDGSDGAVHPIFEETFDIGRTAGALNFSEDPYLSERHCRLVVQNDRWLVQDLQSCNGVYFRLGEEPVGLNHGDRFLLGKQVFSFEWLSDYERALTPGVEHGVLLFGSPLRTPWARIRQVTVAGVHRDVYYLYRTKITLGREDGDLIFPDDEFMSRQHLCLTQASGRALLQDLGSSNGTFLKIRDQHGIESGNLIRLGDQLLRFELA